MKDSQIQLKDLKHQLSIQDQLSKSELIKKETEIREIRLDASKAQSKLKSELDSKIGWAESELKQVGPWLKPFRQFPTTKPNLSSSVSP